MLSNVGNVDHVKHGLYHLYHDPTYLGSLLGKVHPVLDRVELVHACEAAVGREHLGNHVSNTNANTNTNTKGRRAPWPSQRYRRCPCWRP